jgi:hypothetical protein
LKTPNKKTGKKRPATRKRKAREAAPLLGIPAATTSAMPEKAQNVAYCPPPDELDNATPDLKHLGGSKSDKWNLLVCNQTIGAAWFGRNPKPGKELDDQRTAVLAFLAGVNPSDPIEGMMAAQLFACHAASMECYRRAMLPEQTAEGRQMNLTQAAKLTRANAAQVEALAKHRGKGQQKVTVEHVHVYQGGQAIVGNVDPRGVGKNKEGQPYAITHAASAPMRCQDTQREALPIASDAERTLPDARRAVSRSA